MAPKRKSQNKAQHAANARWGNVAIETEEEEVLDEQIEAKRINPDIAVLSTFIQGTNYRRARLGAAVCGTRFPPRSTFFDHQRKMIPRIESSTNRSIEKKSI